jgi:hypothetical protein
MLELPADQKLMCMWVVQNCVTMLPLLLIDFDYGPGKNRKIICTVILLATSILKTCMHGVSFAGAAHHF